METEAARVQWCPGALLGGAAFSRRPGRGYGPVDSDSPSLMPRQSKQNLRLLQKNRSFTCISCTYFYTKPSGENPFFFSDFSHIRLRFHFLSEVCSLSLESKKLIPKPKKKLPPLFGPCVTNTGFWPHRSCNMPSADHFF